MTDGTNDTIGFIVAGIAFVLALWFVNRREAQGRGDYSALLFVAPLAALPVHLALGFLVT
jgi:cbb3-type cytochrome oxidase subunit 3